MERTVNLLSKIKKQNLAGMIHAIRELEGVTYCGLPAKKSSNGIGPITCPYCQDALEHEQHTMQHTLFGG